MSKKKKNLSKECAELIEAEKFIKKILSSDHYVARSEYMEKQTGFSDTAAFFGVLEKSGMLDDYCEKNGISSDAVKSTLEKLSNIHRLVDEKNESYIKEHLKKERKYLDNILSESDKNILLDEDQRRVVLTDEDYCLVVAGAGAGKTTTVAAKVKYLTDKQHIDPKKILVISFTNKAVNELKQRIIGDLHIECPIATFHSTGNAILHKQNSEKLNIADSSKLYYVIQDYLKNTALKKESTVNNLILFFATYFDEPDDGTDLKEFFNKVAKSNYTTMRSELGEYERNVIDSRTKKSVTIQSEVLRSNQEVKIANFLYLNGIDYEYEPLYPYNISYARKPYTPDFLIRQGSNTAYIEHFGITETGENSRYTKDELTRYKKAVNDKIALHKRHGTKLIYTYSGYSDGKSLETHLEEELLKAGFRLEKRPYDEIAEKLISSEENKYIRRLVNLLMRFIQNFKVNGYAEEDFNRLYHSTKNVRTRLFLDICNDCYLEYQSFLKRNNAVDFEDMINESARVLREVKEMKKKLDFDYIIVDEYQDISRQRFDLVSALHEVTDAKIIAVGDDWQSIYAFSGSDISLFTNFEEKMGYAKLLKIVRTYRNSQELIDIAGSFIQKNEKQIKKDLISPKTIDDPVIIYTYDSKRKDPKEGMRSGVNYAIARSVEIALEQIIEYNKAEGRDSSSPVLLLGRYGFDGDMLERSGLFEFISRGSKIKSVKYPYLDITFMTAHASKGLGFDNVIVINGRNEAYGFPSKIEDDPVLSLVIKGDSAIEYAEERRLFYVAMTRTYNRAFFIAPEQNPSEFLIEIKHDFDNVSLRGEWNDDPTNIPSYKKTCPVCGYPMQFRYKKSLGLRLYLCTNEPEICGFMTNEYKAGKLGILKCTECRDGYLVVKPSANGDYFLGCTNYKKDGTGCTSTMTRQHYYRDMKITGEEIAKPVVFPSGRTIAPEEKKKEKTPQKTAAEKEKAPIKAQTIAMPDIKTYLYRGIDLNKTVHTILQCLCDISTERFFPVSVLEDVLLGREGGYKNAKKYNLKSAPLYGSLSGLDDADLEYIIEWLIKNKFILRTRGRYPMLHPTYEGTHLSETLTESKLKKLLSGLKSTEGEETSKVPSMKRINAGDYKLTAFTYSAGKCLSLDKIAEKLNGICIKAPAAEIEGADIAAWLLSDGKLTKNKNAGTYVPAEEGLKLKISIENNELVCGLPAQRYIVMGMPSLADFLSGRRQ